MFQRVVQCQILFIKKSKTPREAFRQQFKHIKQSLTHCHLRSYSKLNSPLYIFFLTDKSCIYIEQKDDFQALSIKILFRCLNTNVLVTAVIQEPLHELMLPLPLQPSKPYLEIYLLVPIIQLLLSVNILLGQLGVRFNDGPCNI